MDDEDMVREIAREMLKYLGFEVDTACDGEEALAIYRERLETPSPVDLVIMDLTIPGGMGGKEAIARLLEMDPAVLAIAASGYSNDPVMADYRRHGFRQVIPKPYTLEELIAIVAEVILEGKGDSACR
jgi:CheY-like chemotaxis protein